jgi:hypothetical protein
LLFDGSSRGCCKITLLLSHHVNEFNPGQNDFVRGHGFETENGAYPSLNPSVVLLDHIVEILGRAYEDGLAILSQAILRIALDDR